MPSHWQKKNLRTREKMKRLATFKNQSNQQKPAWALEGLALQL